jgi:hypothetical protein
MQITDTRVDEIYEGIVFDTLAGVQDALRMLGTWDGEELGEVDELVGQLSATVELGTTHATGAIAALLSMDRYGSYSPPTDLPWIENPDKVVRRTFIWNDLHPRPPFKRFSIRAWRQGDVYVLSIFERDRPWGGAREQEALLAMAMDAPRAISSVEIACTTAPTRGGTWFAIDLEPITAALCSQGFTAIMGETAAADLYERAERTSGNGELTSPSLYFDTTMHKIQLGIRGCYAAVKDDALWPRARLVWRRDGSVITGPRTSGVIDDGVLRAPLFWLSVRAPEGLCASEHDRSEIVRLATALADDLRPTGSAAKSRRRRRRGK